MAILALTIALSWFQKQLRSGQDRSGRRLGGDPFWKQRSTTFHRILSPSVFEVWVHIMCVLWALNNRLWFVRFWNTLYIHITSEYSLGTERAIHGYAVPNMFGVWRHICAFCGYQPLRVDCCVCEANYAHKSKVNILYTPSTFSSVSISFDPSCGGATNS